MTRSEELAARLLEARSDGALIDPQVHTAPPDVETAYRVQDLVVRAMSPGGRVTAWKAIPPRPGTSSAATPVPPSCVLHSPASLSAPHGLLGVEAEVAFRLGDDLAPREALAVIELCATRLAGWESAPALWKLADFQSNAALILGSGTPDWRRIDFERLRVELRVNGVSRAAATSGHPAKNPAALLPWMLAHCASRGQRLQPGDIVTTGSWVGIVAVAPGDQVTASFAEIGAARLALAG